MVPLGTAPHSVTSIRQQGARELIAAGYGGSNTAEANQIYCWVESEVCPAHLHIHWVVCPCGCFISPSFILMKCPDVLYFTSVQNEQSKVLALNLLWSMTRVPRGHGRKWWIPKRGNWKVSINLKPKIVQPSGKWMGLFIREPDVNPPVQAVTSIKCLLLKFVEDTEEGA